MRDRYSREKPSGSGSRGCFVEHCVVGAAVARRLDYLSNLSFGGPSLIVDLSLLTDGVLANRGRSF